MDYALLALQNSVMFYSHLGLAEGFTLFCLVATRA